MGYRSENGFLCEKNSDGQLVDKFYINQRCFRPKFTYCNVI